MLKIKPWYSVPPFPRFPQSLQTRIPSRHSYPDLCQDTLLIWLPANPRPEDVAAVESPSIGVVVRLSGLAPAPAPGAMSVE